MTRWPYTARFVGEPGDGPIETEVVLGINSSSNAPIRDRIFGCACGLGYRDTTFTGNASEPNHFGGRQTYFLDGKTPSRFFRYRDFESDYFVARAELAGNFEFGSLQHRLLVGFDHDQFDNSMLILRYRPGSTITDINTLDPAAYYFLNVPTRSMASFYSRRPDQIPIMRKV